MSQGTKLTPYTKVIVEKHYTGIVMRETEGVEDMYDVRIMDGTRIVGERIASIEDLELAQAA